MPTPPPTWVVDHVTVIDVHQLRVQARADDPDEGTAFVRCTGTPTPDGVHLKVPARLPAQVSAAVTDAVTSQLADRTHLSALLRDGAARARVLDTDLNDHR